MSKIDLIFLENVFLQWYCIRETILGAGIFFIFFNFRTHFFWKNGLNFCQSGIPPLKEISFHPGHFLPNFILKWDSSFSAVINIPTQKIYHPYFHWYFYQNTSVGMQIGRLKWILDIIWPLNQHFHLKNQRNWIKQVLMIKFLSGINCILLHWPKKFTVILIQYWCNTTEVKLVRILISFVDWRT